MAKRPDRALVRAYNVGFGDCFLVSFYYGEVARNILIDFGSTAAPAYANKNNGFMTGIAESIREECRDQATREAKLHAVVATHRHRDHISGFATEGNGPGKIIASLEPDVVVQPWTEDSRARPDAKKATTLSYEKGKPSSARMRQDFAASLDAMHAISASALEQVKSMKGVGKETLAQIQFLADDNDKLKNKSAIANLQAMGKKGRAFYVHCGSPSGLEKVLPGVEIHVLGPPTLEQTTEILKERKRDADEFWQFRAFWGLQLATQPLIGKINGGLFPHAKRCAASHEPPEVRWFLERARRLRGSQLLELVRLLDGVMNNTSVILLFRVGEKSLLFPGDAQIENWSYALSQEKYRQLLQDVEIYKVGHHGSLNATPKSLWDLFKKKRRESELTSVVSTKRGKHGSAKSNTEVPRRTLIAALEKETHFHSTEKVTKKELFDRITIEF